MAKTVGKDEVPSSNLGSSSKIPLESLDSGGISFVSAIFGVGLFLRFFFDPHRDPHAKSPERDRERQTGSSTFLSGFFAGFFALHDLCHEISNRLCRSILLLSGGVGVSAQGKARVVVPQCEFSERQRNGTRWGFVYEKIREKAVFGLKPR
jgi:hypothetical protein